MILILNKKHCLPGSRFAWVVYTAVVITVLFVLLIPADVICCCFVDPKNRK